MLTHPRPNHYAEPGELEADRLQAAASKEYAEKDSRCGRWLILAPLAENRTGHYAGAEFVSGHRSPQTARAALARKLRNLRGRRDNCRRQIIRYDGPLILAIVDGADRDPIVWGEIGGYWG
jgi:hypothetical protein